MDCKTFVMCVCVCGGERRASSCLYQISIFTLCRFTVSFPWIIHKSCAPLSAQSHTLTRVQAQCADIAACQPISVNADNMCLCCLITRPGVKVSGQEELMKKKKKKKKQSHTVQVCFSLYTSPRQPALMGHVALQLALADSWVWSLCQCSDGYN